MPGIRMVLTGTRKCIRQTTPLFPTLAEGTG